ncbi:mannan endo-1,4-beta-mannosidase 6 [Eucalyptus grandis]|uniref:mannan endo-1,4-beta-mannosidase 6 n=1 Tax=Eucalyptus grandis TaxID=71139 RepID=UPI00192EEEC7|nr:mannan endo-1,4-beta-mannosidase 6 [Eucalyptus grandis]
MKPNWRDKALYPILGGATVLLILYLNFDEPSFAFPVLWLPKMGFVGTNSTRFVVVEDGGGGGGGAGRAQSAVYVNGWNSYWLMEESVWGGPSRGRVSEMMRRGAGMGMTVCRTWAFSDGDGPNALQRSPGVFDERVFRGLDYVIVEAQRNRVRVILSLVNNLNAFGGKAQYIRWAQEAGENVSSSADSFFSHPTIKEYYKAYVKAVVTRKNSMTGVHYFDEPAIFAWELMNEPRGVSGSSAPLLQSWITEMAAYIKSLDQRHLITIGVEGFYGLQRQEKNAVNPGEWASSLGTDFLNNSAIHNIDFASVHAYPDSWIPEASLDEKVKYLSQWVDSHIHDGDEILKKPVLFTEVGSSLHKNQQELHQRDIFLKMVYDKIYESAKKRQAGAGALIWQLLVDDTQGYADQFSFVAWNHLSTYKLIIEQSCRLRRMFVKEEMNRKYRHNDPCPSIGS